ncbi:hypothetical protein K402DRAFT_190809 [Aulographum hederae CBS 113979]|uniref:Uncharacterized protein n=1 Tax=Aulographum hederae CBS 113979 TaxID=1176131 RepID=A0A6G1GPC3_9PEZI|nr:hypothetical protein K402DRAFT_190809 [Aulographum hederae CBS 113979]
MKRYEELDKAKEKADREEKMRAYSWQGRPFISVADIMVAYTMVQRPCLQTIWLHNMVSETTIAGNMIAETVGQKKGKRSKIKDSKIEHLQMADIISRHYWRSYWFPALGLHGHDRYSITVYISNQKCFPFHSTILRNRPNGIRHGPKLRQLVGS